MPLGEDVCMYITSDEVVRNRAVNHATPFEYDTLNRIADMGSPMPPSGVEQGLTDRFDNPTYY